ncbi:small integral membrane protein 7 isoform X2 [Microtus pennsylvanicus]|uniref:small integral membrane protein 7 isoform X2 n=1 Tax=Microtus pennsylvanicus TaxID=10058 RepID=UPI003F6AE20E
MIGDILLFGTLLMNAGAVLNFKLRQHPGVLTEPAVLPDLHRPVECVHDALHDCTVRLLRTQTELTGCLGSVSVSDDFKNVSHRKTRDFPRRLKFIWVEKAHFPAT